MMSLISSDFGEFITYFKDWATAEADMAFFMYGGTPLDGVDQATGMEGFDYPFMWLESPDIDFNNNNTGQYIDVYQVGVCFIANAPMDDLAAQVAASVAMFNLMGKFQKQILADNRDKGFLDLGIDMTKREIDRAWSANHFGWRLSFEMSLNANVYLFDS
jgi:hypothetical protein